MNQSKIYCSRCGRSNVQLKAMFGTAIMDKINSKWICISCMEVPSILDKKDRRKKKFKRI